MKPIYFFKHCTALCTTVVLGLAATAPSFAQNSAAQPYTARPDAVVSGIAPANKQILEEKLAQAARVSAAKLDIQTLQAELSAAYKARNSADFVRAVQMLNNRLISYIQSDNTSERIEGAYALLEQMRLRLISREDFETASAIMQKALDSSQTCSTLQCDFLAACAASLAFDMQYIQNISENPALNQRYQKIAILQGLSARNWGSDKADAVMAGAILRATAALGSAQNLADVATDLLSPKKGFFKERDIKGKYQAPNALTQKAVIKTLASLGKEGKKTLKHFAFNRQTELSFVRGNIELAYLPLSEQDRIQNQSNLKEIYCHANYTLSSDEDFKLKKELAYAWGRGGSPAFVTENTENSCQITVPLTPDSRKVAQEWSDVVMKEAVIQAGFWGLPLFSGTSIVHKVKAFFQNSGFFRDGQKLLAAGQVQKASQAVRATAPKAAVSGSIRALTCTAPGRDAAVKKILQSGLDPKKTFIRVDYEYDWFVSGHNQALRGKDEVSKYVQALEKGIKNVPVEEGRVMLDIAANYAEENVSYWVFGSGAQMNKFTRAKAAVKPLSKARSKGGVDFDDAWAAQNVDEMIKSGQKVDLEDASYLSESLF